MVELVFRKFEEAYFDEYKNWFQDESIKNALYGIDEEWLEYVLIDKTGIEYAVFSNEEMVAVVGIEFSSSIHRQNAIKNIAVHPKKFGSGIGTGVINELLQTHPFELWVAFVEINNIVAQSFFKKIGWEQKSIEENMIRFEKRNG